MVKLVIFDCDGVIIDSEPLRFQTYKQLFKSEYEVDLPENDTNYLGKSQRDNIKYFLDMFTLKGDIEDLYNKRRVLLIEVISKIDKSIIMGGLIQLINLFKNNNIMVVVASSSSKYYLENVFRRLEIIGLFDNIFSAEEVEKGKPSPDLFLMAAEKLGINPKDCLVIEDAVSGIKAGKSANMKVIALTSSLPKERLVEADLIVDDLNKINLKKINKLYLTRSVHVS